MGWFSWFSTNAMNTTAYVDNAKDYGRIGPPEGPLREQWLKDNAGKLETVTQPDGKTFQRIKDVEEIPQQKLKKPEELQADAAYANAETQRIVGNLENTEFAMTGMPIVAIGTVATGGMGLVAGAAAGGAITLAYGTGATLAFKQMGMAPPKGVNDSVVKLIDGKGASLDLVLPFVPVPVDKIPGFGKLAKDTAGRMALGVLGDAAMSGTLNWLSPDTDNQDKPKETAQQIADINENFSNLPENDKNAVKRLANELVKDMRVTEDGKSYRLLTKEEQNAEFTKIYERIKRQAIEPNGMEAIHTSLAEIDKSIAQKAAQALADEKKRQENVLKNTKTEDIEAEINAIQYGLNGLSKDEREKATAQIKVLEDVLADLNHLRAPDMQQQSLPPSPSSPQAGQDDAVPIIRNTEPKVTNEQFNTAQEKIQKVLKETAAKIADAKTPQDKKSAFEEAKTNLIDPAKVIQTFRSQLDTKDPNIGKVDKLIQQMDTFLKTPVPAPAPGAALPKPQDEMLHMPRQLEEPFKEILSMISKILEMVTGQELPHSHGQARTPQAQTPPSPANAQPDAGARSPVTQPPDQAPQPRARSSMPTVPHPLPDTFQRYEVGSTTNHREDRNKPGMNVAQFAKNHPAAYKDLYLEVMKKLKSESPEIANDGQYLALQSQKLTNAIIKNGGSLEAVVDKTAQLREENQAIAGLREALNDENLSQETAYKISGIIKQNRNPDGGINVEKLKKHTAALTEQANVLNSNWRNATAEAKGAGIPPLTTSYDGHVDVAKIGDFSPPTVGEQPGQTTQRG